MGWSLVSFRRLRWGCLKLKKAKLHGGVVGQNTIVLDRQNTLNGQTQSWWLLLACSYSELACSFHQSDGVAVASPETLWTLRSWLPYLANIFDPSSCFFIILESFSYCQIPPLWVFHLLFIPPLQQRTGVLLECQNLRILLFQQLSIHCNPYEGQSAAV